MLTVGALDPAFFIVGLSVGLLFTYAFSPPPQVVVKFPTPSNADATVYSDPSDRTCYKFRALEQPCPVDRSARKRQPVGA